MPKFIKSAWLGRGDAGEIFVYLPVAYPGYDMVYDCRGWRQPLLVFGLRPGKFYLLWGSNCDGPLVRGWNGRP